MDKEGATPDQIKPRWFIDLDWYHPNNRSFSQTMVYDDCVFVIDFGCSILSI